MQKYPERHKRSSSTGYHKGARTWHRGITLNIATKIGKSMMSLEDASKRLIKMTENWNASLAT
jgi:hypothetical protein